MKKFFEKLKKIKHIEIYAAVIAVVIIIAIYFTTLAPAKKKEELPDNQVVASTGTYADMIEDKLRVVIGSVSGAGRVSIMVMTDGEGTAELAYDIVEKTVSQTGSNGQIITTTTKEHKLITVNGKPVVLWTNPPNIIGIIVVATGADNVSVKLNILRAVQTIIGDKAVSIEILSGV